MLKVLKAKRHALPVHQESWHRAPAPIILGCLICLRALRLQQADDLPAPKAKEALPSHGLRRLETLKDSILGIQLCSVYMGAAQLHASQEQCESLESKRASLANALHKLEAFQRNILNTLQASDQVTPSFAL